MAAPTEPGFRQNDTLCTSLPSSLLNQCHPAQPSSSPTQPPSLPAQPTSSPRTRGTRRADKREGRTTVRHSGKTQLNVRPQGQANICHYPLSHCHYPPNQRHPRARGTRTRRVDKRDGPPNADPESQPGPTNDSTDSASIPGFSPSSYSCTTATFLLQRRSNVIDSDTSPNSTRCEKGSVG